MIIGRYINYNFIGILGHVLYVLFLNIIQNVENLAALLATKHTFQSNVLLIFLILCRNNRPTPDTKPEY